MRSNRERLASRALAVPLDGRATWRFQARLPLQPHVPHQYERERDGTDARRSAKRATRGTLVPRRSKRAADAADARRSRACHQYERERAEMPGSGATARWAGLSDQKLPFLVSTSFSGSDGRGSTAISLPPLVPVPHR